MIIRDRFVAKFIKIGSAIDECIKRKQDVKAKIDGEWFLIPYTGDEEEMKGNRSDHVWFVKNAMEAVPILFSAEQADVFSSIAESYEYPLDFRLPFASVFLQFTRPVGADYTLRSANDYNRGNLLAVAISQTEHSRSDVERWVAMDKEHGRVSIDYPLDSDAVLINHMSFLYGDWGTESVNWASQSDIAFFSRSDGRWKAIMHWFNVAIACIGYINCENIYLEKQGEVPEAVNRKREAKGKSRLEPYYVCRIKGVQYDSHATGEGSKHGIRYDVRGHFRRLETGKTIWVRPHQRGLTNELYVPKVYKVSKGAKPAGDVK